MSKKLLIAAIVAVLTMGATMAMATDSRLECTGQQGLYMMDVTNMFGNPATVTSYSKMVLIHMSGVEAYGDMDAYGGGTLALGDALTLGLFVARNPNRETGGIGVAVGDATTTGMLGPLTGPIFNDEWSADGVVSQAAVDWVNPFDIILGYKMGDLSLGVSYYLANGKMAYEDNIPVDDPLAMPFPTTDEDDTLTYDGKARLHSVKLGLSYAGGDIQPELWFHYNPFSIVGTSEYDDDDGDLDMEMEQELKGRKFVLGGRLFYSMNKNLKVVPAIAWEGTSATMSIDRDDDLDLGGDITEEDIVQSYKSNTVITGVSVQYKANELFLITSASLKWSKAERTLGIDHDDADNWEYITTSKSFAVPEVAIGLEYQATKILVIRGGIHTTTVWASSTELEELSDDDDDYYDTSLMQTYQSTTANVGIGLVFGNLTIDGTCGSFVLANEDDDGDANLFSNLDLKYMF